MVYDRWLLLGSYRWRLWCLEVISHWVDRLELLGKRSHSGSGGANVELDVSNLAVRIERYCWCCDFWHLDLLRVSRWQGRFR